jgi:single-strand DNA-binding protein
VGFVLSGGSRVVVGRLQQRSWTAEDGSARSTVEVVADEVGTSLRQATATTTTTTRSQDRSCRSALVLEGEVALRGRPS